MNPRSPLIALVSQPFRRNHVADYAQDERDKEVEQREAEGQRRQEEGGRRDHADHVVFADTQGHAGPLQLESHRLRTAHFRQQRAEQRNTGVVLPGPQGVSAFFVVRQLFVLAEGLQPGLHEARA